MFVAGTYYGIAHYLLPAIRAAYEATHQMPYDDQLPDYSTAFNRGEEGGLVGYDDGGGAVIATANEVRLNQVDEWWQVDYQYKKPLTVTNLANEPTPTLVEGEPAQPASLASGTTMRITVDTAALVAEGKLQTNCNDLRVVYSADDVTHQELARSIELASGANNCADSTTTIVAFPLQTTLEQGGSGAGYALYYGNEEAEEPGYYANAYDIKRDDNSTVSATLACPFNGTTECLGQSGVVQPSTATGAIRYSGAKGSALSFDGKDDWISVPVSKPTLPITIEMWIKPNNGGTSVGTLFDSAPGSQNVLRTISGNVEWWPGNPTKGLSISANTWTHLVITYRQTDKNVIDLYKNGQFISTSVGTSLTDFSWTTFKIGVVNSSYDYYGGLMDEFAIYNKALTLNEVEARYNEGNPKPIEADASTLVLYHFDENGDDPRNTGKAIDASGNGNHGTITGAKYVAGLVGVDGSVSPLASNMAGPASYASHQGIFVEEGTTNLVTNPSFEHTTYNTNWGLNYLNYAEASAMFTPAVAKRNSAGPFAAGVMVGGKYADSSSSDLVSLNKGNQINSAFYETLDGNQGSIVFWITPEWNGNDNKAHTIFGSNNSGIGVQKTSGNNLVIWYGSSWAVTKSVTDWVAGTTYSVVVRWDNKTDLGDDVNHASITINDGSPELGYSGYKATQTPGTLNLGSNIDGAASANAIIEGLTIYRRPLWDGEYGIDIGNGDEIAKIYDSDENNGNGILSQDPTLVTGSWDVVLALPTNGTAGKLGTGASGETVTGEAWSHPHASNVLYTNTTNTGGFMMNSDLAVDGWSDENNANMDSVEFNGTNTNINAGSNSSLDDLHDNAFTAEAWVRADGWGVNSDSGRILAKSAGAGDGWLLGLDSRYGLVAMITGQTSGSSVITSTSGFSPDLVWHHVAMTYDDEGDRKVRLWLDGTLVGSGNAVQGAVKTDNLNDLFIGSLSSTTWNFDGAIAWIRISNSIRYTTNFTPPSRFSSPTTDANVVAQWNMDEGTGTSVTNDGGASSCGGTPANCNGTLSNGTWNDGGALATGEKIYSGGYKWTSNDYNQGIKYTKTGLTAGKDYVVRAIANNGDGSGLGQPKIYIYDETNHHDITELTGTTTSTRTDPDVLLFTFELPTVARYNPVDDDESYDWVDVDTTSISVKLVNASNSGEVHLQQVEVYENLIDNPSLEIGSGDPWVLDGHTSTLEIGEASQKTSGCHSGNSCYQQASNEQEGQTKSVNSPTGFYSSGVWGKSTAGSFCLVNPGFSLRNNGYSHWPMAAICLSTTEKYHMMIHNHYVATQDGQGFMSWYGGASGYADDAYTLRLSDVSLTVTPASQTNSTETTGLRVDGADTLTQSITGLSATNGVIRFKYTPRHGAGALARFGTTYPTMFMLGSGTDYILVYYSADTVIRMCYNMNNSGQTCVNSADLTGSFSAGTTYDIEVSYFGGGNMIMKFNGVAIITLSNIPASFSITPTVMNWGSWGTGSLYQGDGTFSNFTTLSATENTTSPYYKFGSKSVKLDNSLSTTSDQYTIAIDPNSTATHTLSAYVYDATAGNIGGTVGSSVAQLYANGLAIATTYTDIGGGWWRLTGALTATDDIRYYGVEVKTGKTIYIDGIQLEQKSYATSYADGSIGAGYSWSGVENQSAGVRSALTSSFVATEPNATEGAISFWFSPTWDDSLSVAQQWKRTGYISIGGGGWGWGKGFLITTYTDQASSSLNNVALHHYGSTGSIGISRSVTIIRNSWHHVVYSWGSGTSYLSVDGSRSNEVLFNNDTGNGIVSMVSNSNSTISDLRIFSQALTPSEVSDLYYQGLSTHTSSTEQADRYQETGTYTSPVIDLHANGMWGAIPASFTDTADPETNGTINYFTRTRASFGSWSDWQQLTSISGSNYDIVSDARRYLQWKAELSSAESSQAQTPVITNMSINYVEDTTPPDNPTVTALGYSDSQQAEANLTSGQWYNHSNPKFVWDPGEDPDPTDQSQSGIHGYHVLLTQTANVNPVDHTGDNCYSYIEDTQEEGGSIIVGTNPATCVLSDGIYYLYVQSQDNSGNTNETPAHLFTYKYDKTIPGVPASVSSTTVGYSANNSFDFFWPAAVDVGGSGLSHYEYKTGTSDLDDPFSDWQATSGPDDRMAYAVTAYTEGQNLFYVRTVDNAGNYSAISSNVAASPFYFNESAPTAPTNLTITPATVSASPATSNVFSVSWDKPDSFSGELSKYYYCVNCTPSAATMTETTSVQTVERALANMALATQQGKNTFYLVAEDNNINATTGHGNRNFDAYATAEFYASTTAPPAPTSLSISDTSDRDNETWRLTLVWDESSEASGVSRYDVYRSTDEGDSYSKIGNVSSGAYTDTNLTFEETYSYKVTAVDNAGSESLFSNIVSLAPVGKYTDPPSAGGVPSVAVGSTTATVSWQTSRSAFGTVEYGKGSTYGSAASSTIETATHSIKITGLAPGTNYHYRVHSLDDSSLVGYDRAMAYSNDFTFTTLNQADISSVEVTDAGLDFAVIQWDTASLASSLISYGLTTEYGEKITVSTTPDESTHTARLSNLEHSTKYHFRIQGVTADETDIYSEDYTFSTLTFPTVTALIMNTDQAAAGATLVLAWATNVPTTGTVQYQPVDVDLGALTSTGMDKELVVNSPDGPVLNVDVLQALSQEELALLPAIPTGEVETIYQGDLSKRHIQRISGLKDGAMYVITVRGTDEYGNEAIGDPIRYVTGADTRPPEIQNLILETPISGTGSEASASIIVSWETDEPAYGQVLWGIGAGTEFPNSTEKSSEATTKHVMVLRDLQPTQSYHLKVEATDIAGNITATDDMVVVTPTAQQAAFDIVLKNLEDIFGFLK